MTQQEMLSNQWSDNEPSLFGFTDSDWYRDAKEILSFGWMLNNGDKLTSSPQQQAQLMYSVPVNNQPNAQYVDPRLNTQMQAMPSSSSPILIYGGLAVLAYLVFK